MIKAMVTMTETVVLFHALKQRMTYYWTQKAHVRNVKRHCTIQYPVIKLTILQSRTLPVLLLSLLIALHLLALLQELSQLARKYRVILPAFPPIQQTNIKFPTTVVSGKATRHGTISIYGWSTKRCMLLLQLSSIWLWR